MRTGFEDHSTERLMRFSLALLDPPARMLGAPEIQILARITAELAQRLQELEERRALN